MNFIVLFIGLAGLINSSQAERQLYNLHGLPEVFTDMTERTPEQKQLDANKLMRSLALGKPDIDINFLPKPLGDAAFNVLFSGMKELMSLVVSGEAEKAMSRNGDLTPLARVVGEYMEVHPKGFEMNFNNWSNFLETNTEEKSNAIALFQFLDPALNSKLMDFAVGFTKKLNQENPKVARNLLENLSKFQDQHSLFKEATVQRFIRRINQKE